MPTFENLDPKLWRNLPHDLWPIIKSYFLRPSIDVLLWLDAIAKPMPLRDGGMIWFPMSISNAHSLWPSKENFDINRLGLSPSTANYDNPRSICFARYRKYPKVTVFDIYQDETQLCIHEPQKGVKWLVNATVKCPTIRCNIVTSHTTACNIILPGSFELFINGDIVEQILKNKMIIEKCWPVYPVCLNLTPHPGFTETPPTPLMRLFDNPHNPSLPLNWLWEYIHMPTVTHSVSLGQYIIARDGVRRANGRGKITAPAQFFQKLQRRYRPRIGK